MRKLLLVLVPVIAVGGYSALWFLQAGKAKEQVEFALAKINEKQQFLTYESVSTTGFPSDVVVIVNKPVLSGRIDNLLKDFATHMSSQATPQDQELITAIQNMPEWNSNLALDGNLSIRLNAFSDRYTLASSGSWQNKNTIGGNTDTVMSNPTAPSMCTLNLERSGGWFKAMWSMSFVRDEKALAEDFRGLDCIFPANKLVDTQSKEVLTSNGDFRFYVLNQPDGTQRNVRFYLKVVDSEITQAGEKWIEQYLKLFNPGSSFPSHLSMYGKQNIEVDFSFNGPVDFKQQAKDAPFDFNLGKFLMSSDAYKTTGQLQVASSVSGGNRTGRLILKSDSTFTEKYDALIQDVVRGIISDIYSGKDQQFADLKPKVEQYTEEQLYGIVQPAIPNFFSLGRLVQSIDLTYQGASDMSSGDVNLADLEFSAAPYGIKGSGTAKMAQGQMFPVTNMTLACNNCHRMIDDIVAYAGRVQKMMSYFDPAAATSMSIDPRMVEGLKNFLAALALPVQDAKDKANFNYTIISDGATGISVSGKPMDQVMGLYAQHLGAAMQPASGNPE